MCEVPMCEVPMCEVPMCEVPMYVCLLLQLEFVVTETFLIVIFIFDHTHMHELLHCGSSFTLLLWLEMFASCVMSMCELVTECCHMVLYMYCQNIVSKP